MTLLCNCLEGSGSDQHLCIWMNLNVMLKGLLQGFLVQLKRTLVQFPCYCSPFGLVWTQKLHLDTDQNNWTETTSSRRSRSACRQSLAHCWSNSAPTACSAVHNRHYYYYCFIITIVCAPYVLLSLSELTKGSTSSLHSVKWYNAHETLPWSLFRDIILLVYLCPTDWRSYEMQILLAHFGKMWHILQGNKFAFLHPQKPHDSWLMNRQQLSRGFLLTGFASLDILCQCGIKANNRKHTESTSSSNRSDHRNALYVWKCP